MISSGTLYLFPTPLGKTGINSSITEYEKTVLTTISHLAVENIQSAQRFLQWIQHPVQDYQLNFYELHKSTSTNEQLELITILLNGDDVGVLSEAGCPGIADPGTELVQLAHQTGIQVRPLSGPNSMIMALMASGLNGQKFRFNGYLPQNEQKLKKAIKSLEQSSALEHQSELFMEAPHRNVDVFLTLRKTLTPSTHLTIACNLTMDNEFLATKTIQQWQEDDLPPIEKLPCIFILEARPIIEPKPTIRQKKKVNRF